MRRILLTLVIICSFSAQSNIVVTLENEDLSPEQIVKDPTIRELAKKAKVQVQDVEGVPLFFIERVQYAHHGPEHHVCIRCCNRHWSNQIHLGDECPRICWGQVPTNTCGRCCWSLVD